jgi:glycosyltransferase involved in cell wall biosynthesis
MKLTKKEQYLAAVAARWFFEYKESSPDIGPPPNNLKFRIRDVLDQSCVEYDAMDMRVIEDIINTKEDVIFDKLERLTVSRCNFSKKIFTDNGMPEDHQVVIPHGINSEQFLNKDKYPLKTKKKIKFLVNIAQPHLRKNIPNVFKAYGKAFTKADDVCLVIKIAKKSPQPKTDSVPFDDIYRNFCKEFKNHAEVEIISDFIVDIVPLYNACDVVFSMSYCECFWLPGIEAVAANKIIIHPNYGGALDFLNENNSILIPGKEIRADIRLQYWEPSPYAKMFEPNVDKATQALKDVYNNYEDYLKKFTPGMQEVAAEYTWANATKKIIDLCK